MSIFVAMLHFTDSHWQENTNSKHLGCSKKFLKMTSITQSASDGDPDKTLEASKIKEALQVQHTPGRQHMQSLCMFSHFSFQA